MSLLSIMNGCYRYERISWFPVLITLVIASAVGGKHLFNPPPAVPATASAVLSFASTLAGFSITYSPLSSDFTSYYRPNVSRYEIQILKKLLKFNLKLAGRFFYLPMLDFYYPSYVSILSFMLSYTNFHTWPDTTPMSWSGYRCCGILCPCLGARICRRQRRRATWSYALTFRQFRQISYSSAEPLSCWQQCYCILLHFNQPPSVHPYIGCSTPVCIFGCSNSYVSGVVSLYNNKRV